MGEIVHTAADIERRSQAYPVLRQLGFPPGDQGETALVRLHAGAAYHALAVIEDVVVAYEQTGSLSSTEVGYKSLITAPGEGHPLRDHAESYYRAAIELAPDLAEAHFSLARVHWDRGQLDAAAAVYRKVVGMKPHGRAPSHAPLVANAYWNLGEVHALLGLETEALEAFGEAVERLPTFGVHHVKYASLLRKHGFLDDAMEHFNRTMAYSHRYFPEFVLPSLTDGSAEPAADGPLESLMRLKTGEHVVFWNGRYYAVPEKRYPITGDKLAKGTAEEVPFAPYAADAPAPAKGGLGQWVLKWTGRGSPIGGRRAVRVSDTMMNLEQSS